MKVLIGTTNPSKVNRFEELLNGCDITFYTLKDLKISGEPEETGKTPEENAAIKARYYGRFFDPVVCNDSGLYFASLPFDDRRQPGLNVRTPNGGKRLNDEEMLTYYTGLIHDLGGEVEAFYSEGFAVCHAGTVYSLMETEEEAKLNSFYMTDTPTGIRHEGWPLDSISLNRSTRVAFADIQNSGIGRIFSREYKKRCVKFLKDSLGIKE